MTIDEALKLLRISPYSLDEAALIKAFSARAKEFHPDTARNYKGKAASADKLNAAIAARNLIRKALSDGDLPRRNEARTTMSGPGEGAREAESRRTSKSSFQQNPFFRDERGWHDHHHPPPFMRAVEMPVLGHVLGLAWIFGVIVALVASILVAWPFVIVGGVVLGLMGENRREKLKARAADLGEYVTGLPTLMLAYVTSGVGVFLLSGEHEDRFLILLGLAWFAISCFLLDEIYSMLRYYLFLRPNVRRALAALSDEG
jgi:hypothetical protein